MAGRIWLDVPYKEKDPAKAAGARWDGVAERWYAPRPGMAALDRWAALPDVPDLLPGEDRSFGSGLFVDLVPTSCWFTNVRSCVDQRDWERLRRMINGRAGHRCEACGRGKDRETQRWLEAHERWSYDEATAVQRLRRLVCLCTDCHRATHFGLAEVQGKRAQAMAHLRSVTGMTAAKAERHVQAAFQQWRQRSARTWTLDLGILTGAGVTVVPPPSAAGRETAARQALHQARPVRTTPAAVQPARPPVRAMAPPEPPMPPLGALHGLLDRQSTMWVTIPPWPWFCHTCDSNSHPPDVAYAKVRKPLLGRREIVCQPYEWRHAFKDLSLANLRGLEALARSALAAPGSAAVWDPSQHRFQVVTGRQVDWRKDRDRRR